MLKTSALKDVFVGRPGISRRIAVDETGGTKMIVGIPVELILYPLEVSEEYIMDSVTERLESSGHLPDSFAVEKRVDGFTVYIPRKIAHTDYYRERVLEAFGM